MGWFYSDITSLSLIKNATIGNAIPAKTTRYSPNSIETVAPSAFAKELSPMYDILELKSIIFQTPIAPATRLGIIAT